MIKQFRSGNYENFLNRNCDSEAHELQLSKFKISENIVDIETKNM